MTERTTVRLPADLLERAKRRAAAEGRTLTALLEEGLRLVVAAQPQRLRPRRKAPRISKARGGLVAGVDLERVSDLQEIEDLARVRRMTRSP